MATSMPSNLKHDVITVHDLVKQYQNGQISVPEFQRDYVWKPSKAPKLIDSLYRDFPISSLLIWESGDGHVNARSAASARGKTSWLIDGQQRVTTLARVKDGALDTTSSRGAGSRRTAGPTRTRWPTLRSSQGTPTGRSATPTRSAT